jgi:hypothetical protein
MKMQTHLMTFAEENPPRSARLSLLEGDAGRTTVDRNSREEGGIGPSWLCMESITVSAAVPGRCAIFGRRPLRFVERTTI